MNKDFIIIIIIISRDFVAVSLSNSQPDPQQNRWWGYRCQVNCYVTHQTFHLFVHVSYSNQTLWGVLLKSSQVVLLNHKRIQMQNINFNR